MSGGVRVVGLTELIRELTNAPQDIRRDAMVHVQEATEGTADETRAAYRRRSKSGTLAARVQTSYPTGSVLVGVVQSTAPHSHLFEFGTKRRATSTGANRGVMPKEDPSVMVTVAQRRRAGMFRKLVELLRSRGYEVSGA